LKLSAEAGAMRAQRFALAIVEAAALFVAPTETVAAMRAALVRVVGRHRTLADGRIRLCGHANLHG